MEEIEWQFDAVDLRPVERWLEARLPGAGGAPTAEGGLPRATFAPAEPHEIADTYFDTADWRFHRAGLTVRIRRRNGSFEATFKTMDPPEDGLRQRTEITSALPSDEVSALVGVDGRVGEWVRSLAGRQPVIPLFNVKSSRRAFTILLEDQVAGEVVLDEATFEQPAGREPVRIKRVEVEVAPAALEQVRPSVEDLRTACRLTPAAASKFEVGLLTLDRGPQGSPDPGSLVAAEAPSMGELGFAVLRRAFLEFLRNEPGTRIGEDIEALHDMRVAARRMRAAMMLFEPALPKRAQTLRAELRWIAGLLGDVRDLDTQLAWLASWSQEAAPADSVSLDQLRSELETRRHKARQRMLQGLDSVRFGHLISRLTRMLRAGPPRRSPAGRTAALAAFPGLIERRYNRVRKLGRALTARAPAGDYHRLRIRCKRLRYAVENGRDLYGPTAQEFVVVLARLQDLLGQHQDAVVAAAHLQELLGSSARRLPPQVVFLMGRISQRHEQQAAKLRKRFGNVFAPVQGKAWTRLARVMEKGRGQPPTEWPPVPQPVRSRTPGVGV